MGAMLTMVLGAAMVAVSGLASVLRLTIVVTRPVLRLAVTRMGLSHCASGKRYRQHSGSKQSVHDALSNQGALRLPDRYREDPAQIERAGRRFGFI